MASHDAFTANPGGERLKLRRVRAGEQLHVKILSDVGPRVMGLIYHWQGPRKKGRSIPCLPKCPDALHRTGSFWHGYLAVEIWDGDRRQWKPWVLEVTEALELDMRGRVQRGQVWLISRALGEKGDSEAVTGICTEELPAHAVPLSFDIRPILWGVYHSAEIELNVASWLPDRIYARPTDGPPPAALLPDAREQPMTADEMAEVRRQLRERGMVQPLKELHKRNGR